jgi:hypothetical protein
MSLDAFARAAPNAEREHWPGETEGIDRTLQFPRQKRTDAARISHRASVQLGLP